MNACTRNSSVALLLAVCNACGQSCRIQRLEKKPPACMVRLHVISVRRRTRSLRMMQTRSKTGAVHVMLNPGVMSQVVYDLCGFMSCSREVASPLRHCTSAFKLFIDTVTTCAGQIVNSSRIVWIFRVALLERK